MLHVISLNFFNVLGSKNTVSKFPKNAASDDRGANLQTNVLNRLITNTALDEQYTVPSLTLTPVTYSLYSELSRFSLNIVRAVNCRPSFRHCIELSHNLGDINWCQTGATAKHLHVLFFEI